MNTQWEYSNLIFFCLSRNYCMTYALWIDGTSVVLNIVARRSS